MTDKLAQVKKLTVVIDSINREIKTECENLKKLRGIPHNLRRQAYTRDIDIAGTLGKFSLASIDVSIKLKHMELSFLNRQYMKLRAKRYSLILEIRGENTPYISPLPKVDFSVFKTVEEVKAASELLRLASDQIERGNERYFCFALGSLVYCSNVAHWGSVYNKLKKQIDLALQNVVKDNGNFRGLSDLVSQYGVESYLAIKHPLFQRDVMPELMNARKKKRAVNLSTSGPAAYATVSKLAIDLLKDHPHNITKLSLSSDNAINISRQNPSCKGELELINPELTQADSLCRPHNNNDQIFIRMTWHQEMQESISARLKELGQ